MNRKQFDHIQNVRELVKELANVCLYIDDENSIDNKVYNDEDLLHATMIFNHIVSNIVITKSLQEGNENSAKMYGYELRSLILQYTGIDTHDVAESLNNNKKNNG